MSDLRSLYQELILDHGKSPRNFGKLADANRRASGNNPLCGDKLTLYLRVEDDVVRDVRFEGSGCAISTASASMLTQAIKGRTTQAVAALFDRFHALVTGGESTSGADAPELGKLEVFAGVREFPVRVKCATLVWHTLVHALEHDGGEVTTE
ncbi:MAG: SUF system NifU family Fe-S cluster assembly protein [Deltaproteobacteria bacterium]|nr:MAG: SUF system NifU family Fe-S cluster assembly protein [Deltaproteobacteria bacterium]